jgi:peptidoglycan/xylan/chitin deacetylase (PgdA/CDA1 family)
MLTFRNINIIFLLLLTVLITLKITTGLAAWYFVLPAIAYLLVVSYGSYYVGSNFFMPVVCEVQTSDKKIALTFDDGPAVNFTPSLLDVLTKYNINATFFCIGNRIGGNENIISDVMARGHIIGNHSHSHHYLFDFFSRNKMQKDLSKMDNAVQNLFGKRPLMFRPPYGVTTPAMKRVMINGNYTAVGWNIRSLDTVIKNEEKLFQRVTKAIKPGSIILFHDTSETTLNVLPGIIEYALGNGYTFERLDKLLNKPAYA